MRSINVLFTICGRAGSKGVANKNIRNFLGAPLINFSLVDAFLSFENMKEINKYVLVDSDSDTILELAEHFMPCVFLHKREKKYATDTVAKVEAIGAAVRDFYVNNIKLDCVIDLDITSPLRTTTDIEKLFNVYMSSSKDIVFSVVNARRNPYFNMVELIGDKVQLCKPSLYTCRQAAPSVFEMNASIYTYNPRIFMGDKKHFFEYSLDCVSMTDYGVLDIDSERDFSLMELVYKNIAEEDNAYFRQKRFLASQEDFKKCTMSVS